MLKTVKQQEVNTTKTIFIKFKAESITSILCDYSDAFILVTRDITITADNDAYVYV